MEAFTPDLYQYVRYRDIAGTAACASWTNPHFVQRIRDSGYVCDEVVDFTNPETAWFPRFTTLWSDRLPQTRQAVIFFVGLVVITRKYE